MGAAGFEYYPLDDRRLRLHAFYSWSNQVYSSCNTLTMGLTWRMDFSAGTGAEPPLYGKPAECEVQPVFFHFLFFAFLEAWMAALILAFLAVLSPLTGVLSCGSAVPGSSSSKSSRRCSRLVFFTLILTGSPRR